MTTIQVLAILLGLTVPCLPQTVPEGTKFLVKLSDSLSSKTSRKGDLVRAVIISPERLRGGRLEGAVEEATGPRLRFHFHTLHYKDQTIRVRTEIVGVVSSKGNPDQDDLEQRVSVQAGTVVAHGPAVALDEGSEIRLVGAQQ